MQRLSCAALIIFLLGLTGCAGTTSIAVKRGQQAIEPSALPLVCLAVTTDNAALPLDAIDLEDTRTHQKIHAVLSKTFDREHPDMLTALSGTNRSLSLPILHLPPGKYLIQAMEFVGPSAGIGRDSTTSSLEFDLRGYGFVFEVKAGCVNYVGGIVIGSAWRSISAPFLSNNIKPTTATSHFSAEIHAEDSAARDQKWATDVVPGLKTLPAVNSELAAAE